MKRLLVATNTCVGRHYPAFIAHTGSCARPKPSSFLRPHLWVPRAASLCRLLRIPAGSRPFPALSPQSLYRRLVPYPAAFLRCIYSFLPRGLRPRPRGHKLGTHKRPSQCNFNDGIFSRLQTFVYLQAPILARPPGCTYRCELTLTGQPGRLHHA